MVGYFFRWIASIALNCGEARVVWAIKGGLLVMMAYSMTAICNLVDLFDLLIW